MRTLRAFANRGSVIRRARYSRNVASAASALLRVTDDGRGFDAGARPDSEASCGLRSMAERAEVIGGRLSFTSRPGIGTTVTATVPVRSG